MGLGETEFFGGRHGTCSHCSHTRRIVDVVVLAALGNGTWHSGTRCRGTRPITGCSRSRSEGNLAFLVIPKTAVDVLGESTRRAWVVVEL